MPNLYSLEYLRRSLAPDGELEMGSNGYPRRIAIAFKDDITQTDQDARMDVANSMRTFLMSRQATDYPREVRVRDGGMVNSWDQLLTNRTIKMILEVGYEDEFGQDTAERFPEFLSSIWASPHHGSVGRSLGLP